MLQGMETKVTTSLRVRFVLALAVGSALEFYDFAVFSQLGRYIGPQIFPSFSPAAQELSFWASYGVAFIIRPLGALVFGHVGDRHSRKNSLVYSLLLMAAPTALMGCIPPFSVISWAAPILLVLLRLMQGLAVGGENGMSIVYLYEAAPVSHRALMVALGWSGIPVGVAGGMAVLLILKAACTQAEMELWGWRVALLVGALTGVVGIFLRRVMPDPAIFLAAKQQVDAELEREAKEVDAHCRPEHSMVSAGGVRIPSGHHNLPPFPSSVTATNGSLLSKSPGPTVGTQKVPAAGGTVAGGFDLVKLGEGRKRHVPRRILYLPALAVLRCHWYSVLLQFTWEFWMAAGFYAYSGLWPTLVTAHVPGGGQVAALVLTMGSLLLLIPSACAVAWLCDRGMHRMKAAAALYFLALATTLPSAALSPVALSWAAIAQVWACGLVGALGAILAPGMCPLYPTEVRGTGFSLAHQLAMGVVGGMTPLISSAAALRLGPFGGLMPWLAACAAVSMVVSAWLVLTRQDADWDPPLSVAGGCEGRGAQLA